MCRGSVGTGSSRLGKQRRKADRRVAGERAGGPGRVRGGGQWRGGDCKNKAKGKGGEEGIGGEGKRKEVNEVDLGGGARKRDKKGGGDWGRSRDERRGRE